MLILEAFEVMADRVLKLLRPEVLYAITAHLEQLEVFIVALTAEMEDGSLCLGLTSELPNGNYVVVAKQRNQKDRTRFELGSTIFHELVHVATWSDRKVDLDKYQDIYQYYHQTIGLDNFTSVGRIEIVERVVRVFQGALFGPEHIINTWVELEQSACGWQHRYSLMLELAIRDQLRVFSQPRFQKAAVIDMTKSETIRLVPEELVQKRGITCILTDGPLNYKPIYRGTLLWLREQSIQAEQDPNREWLGFRHEFELLLSGKHPDPHPERIILGKETDDFDPNTLQYPDTEIELSDNSGFRLVGDEGLARYYGYPVKSQQFLALLCRDKLNSLLGIDEHIEPDPEVHAAILERLMKEFGHDGLAV